jgi:hypothetical protein
MRMPAVLEKCDVCQALLDEEDLFCANCGTEAPNRSPTGDEKRPQWTTHQFQCEGCGAAMSYDASAQTLRCPFCGSLGLSETSDGKTLAPQRVVGFQVSRGQAEQILEQWLGTGFWRPSDLSRSAVIENMAAVYVPYWVFEATCLTFWNADSDRTPPGASGDWVPLHGEHRQRYAGLLVGASATLTPQETTAICPFDLQQALPMARQSLEALEAAACAELVPGRCRNLKVNVRLEGLHSEPVLLPVWIMAYRYRDEVYRFLINGQTGKAGGEAPFSWFKLLCLLGVILGILAVVGLIAAISAR